MARAIWKGAISFGLVHIPVELHSAEQSKGLDLDMLDRRDFAPIGYKRYNKETGKDVDWNDIVKGYEYEKGQYVVLSDEDLKRANVEATQTIDILAFVDAREIPPIYFEQPYYLSPGKGGDKVYLLLRETLKKADKVGVAQVVIRTKQRLAALLPLDKVIVLNILRYQDELRSTADLALPDEKSKRTAVSDKEIEMAMSLVENMSEDWDPSAYHDTFREDIMAMIERKIEANQTKTITEPETEERPRETGKVIDLMELLKQSIGSKNKAASRSTATKSAASKATSRKPATNKASGSKAANSKHVARHAASK
ncbi:MAG TPA: Ku protein [Methylophilaceae bacterium]|nr:Ku protein [Methylophilaceae bacterium]